MDTRKKQAVFAEEKKNNMPYILIILFAVIIIAAAVYYFSVYNDGDNRETGHFGKPVAAPRSYVGETVMMTETEPVIKDGRLFLPLETVLENGIVTFEAENDEGFSVPLMAYITPSGRLFAGSCMCEPCAGRRFYLAGETLVCEKCRTTYDIEDHTFIRGSALCGAYPPVYMEPELVDGFIVIDTEKILGWRIREF